MQVKKWLELGIQNHFFDLYVTLGDFYQGMCVERQKLGELFNVDKSRDAYTNALKYNLSPDLLGYSCFQLWMLLKSTDPSAAERYLNSSALDYGYYLAQEQLGLRSNSDECLELLEKAYSHSMATSWIQSKRVYDLARKFYQKGNYQKYCFWLAKSCTPLSVFNQASFERMIVCYDFLGIKEAELEEFSLKNIGVDVFTSKPDPAKM
jgi:hypothetical protein